MPDKEWPEVWGNSQYIKEVLIKVVEQLIKEVDGVKEDDFDCPNHYAKLMFRAGKLKMAEEIKEILSS